MRLHVLSRTPEEACGLVAGQRSPGGDATACAVLEIPNQLHSPVRFRMDPQAQLEAFLVMEEAGWELVAIFHSHPNGPAYPSNTDLAEACYPEALALIWSPEAGQWRCRGFRLEKGLAHEIALKIG